MGVLTASRAGMRSDNANAAADQARSSALNQIATFIPSDVVATYVALQGIFSPGSKSTLWILFCIGIGLCILLPLLNFLASRKPSAPPGTADHAQAGAKEPGWTNQIIVIAMALVAFTAYAMALPSTVFNTVFSSANLWGAASALVLAILLPAIASAVGIKP